jgi:hypothetical protein
MQISIIYKSTYQQLIWHQYFIQKLFLTTIIIHNNMGSFFNYFNMSSFPLWPTKVYFAICFINLILVVIILVLNSCDKIIFQWRIFICQIGRETKQCSWLFHSETERDKV